jgi:hypothetical protein
MQLVNFGDVLIDVEDISFVIKVLIPTNEEGTSFDENVDIYRKSDRGVTPISIALPYAEVLTGISEAITEAGIFK